jgi:putative peptidoglycan lipid II flippase
VVAATALLAVFLMWGPQAFPWIGLACAGLQARIGLLALMMPAAWRCILALLAAGLKLRQLVRAEALPGLAG